MRWWRWTVLLSFAGIGLLLAGCANKAATPAAIDAVSEVHPCDSSSTSDSSAVQLTSTPAAAAGTVDRRAGTGLPGCDGPDFSQRCTLWGGDEYDHGAGQDIGCGKTMAQCGCALTSAASLLVRYGVTRGPDGQATTPKSLNDWFKGEGRATASGTVSRGYVYGGVNWLAVAAYSKQAAAKFGTPELTYAGSLGADLGGLRREVENGRPVILEEPGHFILATNLAFDSVAIADPFYADRTRLDAPSYKNRFLSGRLYRPGPDVSAIMVAAPAGVPFVVRDAAGKATGRDPKSLQPTTEIGQSSFSREAAWRDPTCTAASPRQDAGVDMAILAGPAAGRFSVDVQGGADGNFSLAVYAYDQAGGLTLQSFDGKVASGAEAHVTIDYTPQPGGKQKIEMETTAAVTPSTGGAGLGATPTPGATTAAGTVKPTLTPTRTPTQRATATRTPTPPPPPGPATKLEIALAPSAFFCDGDTYTSVTATALDANGNPAAPTALAFTATSGFITPQFATTKAGTANAKLYPPSNGTQIQVTVRVNGIVQGPSASATFTCQKPIVRGTFVVPIGPIIP